MNPKFAAPPKFKMGCLDGLVSCGKKFLPPPGVLFITHLLYLTANCVLFFLEDILYKSHFNTCRTWVNWVLIGFAIFLTVLVAIAKFKEKGDILSTIISTLAFFATILGLQFFPFYCYNWGSTFVYWIIRIAICIPLAIIYTILCKADLDQILPA
ncbi:hypothetical protein ACHWQZ_G015415 [Mnemiopsis leidyi]